MKHFIPIFFILISTIISCQTHKEGQEQTTSDKKISEILGTWENVSMNVEIRSKDNNADSIDFLDVPEGKWEEVLQIRPIETKFNEDSSFVSEYTSLADTLIFTSSGEWWISGDSLIMISEGQRNSYLFQMEGNRGHFTGFVDWDQDGVTDDLYKGVQIKK